MDQTTAIGLGHVRLSIVDLSRLGHRPLISADGLVVLIFDGEICNFRELKIGLEARGFAFHRQSDTEVPLNIYLSEGDAIFARLNGIFCLYCGIVAVNQCSWRGADWV